MLYNRMNGETMTHANKNITLACCAIFRALSLLWREILNRKPAVGRCSSRVPTGHSLAFAGPLNYPKLFWLPSTRLTISALGTFICDLTTSTHFWSPTYASASTCLHRCILLTQLERDGSVKSQYETQRLICQLKPKKHISLFISICLSINSENIREISTCTDDSNPQRKFQITSVFFIDHCRPQNVFKVCKTLKVMET